METADVSKPEEEKKKPGGLLGWYREKVLGTAEDTWNRWTKKKSDVPKVGDNLEEETQLTPKPDVVEELAQRPKEISDEKSSTDINNTVGGEISITLKVEVTGTENWTPENQTAFVKKFQSDNVVDAFHQVFSKSGTFIGRS